MGQPYSLKVTNNSTMDGNFCVFQEVPDVNVPGIMTLAWLSKRARSGTDVTFTWELTYSFVWSEQGELKPGVKFMASETLSGADLVNYNQVGFDYEGTYKFKDLTQGPRSGSLHIRAGAEISPQQAAVGIGMSGVATFVVPAQPNIELYFTPHPKYYLVFGNYEQGVVIDITQTNKVAEIKFDNTFTVTKSLNQKNLWAS
jgi:hypothetical protein